MVRNNIEADVKVRCIERGKTQTQVAKEIDTTRAYVNRVIKRNQSLAGLRGAGPVWDYREFIAGNI